MIAYIFPGKGSKQNLLGFISLTKIIERIKNYKNVKNQCWIIIIIVFGADIN